MKHKRFVSTSLIAAMAGGLALPAAFGASGPDRTILPIPEPDYPRSTVLDARDAKPPPRFEIKAPAGAPNVIIVLVAFACGFLASHLPRRSS